MKIKKSPLANLFYEAGILNKTPRTGFRHLGRWSQSVGEHTFRTVLIAYAIAHIENKNKKKVEIEKVVTMALFHDFAEERTLDLDYISQKYNN
jgi:putative hydrolase of HD superfamily